MRIFSKMISGTWNFHEIVWIFGSFIFCLVKKVMVTSLFFLVSTTRIFSKLCTRTSKYDFATSLVLDNGETYSQSSFSINLSHESSFLTSHLMKILKFLLTRWLICPPDLSAKDQYLAISHNFTKRLQFCPPNLGKRQ